MQEFEFVDEGRKFFCSVETPRHAGMAPWWWFHLESNRSTRYAPFEASAKDTKQSVQARIVAYYAELLVIKERPVHPRKATWGRPASVPPVEQALPVASTVAAKV